MIPKEIVMVLIILASTGLQAQSTGGIQIRSRWESKELQPSWVIAGNATLSLGKWSLPFTAQYSNRQLSYTHPFNKFGIRPTFKNIVLYAGHSSMNFSPLFFQGQTFLGGGIEYKGSRLLTKAFYGQFRREGYDREHYSPSRTGTGFQAEMKFKNQECGAGVIRLVEKETAFSSRKENFSAGCGYSIKMGNKIRWEYELAANTWDYTLFSRKQRGGFTFKNKTTQHALHYARTGPGFNSWGLAGNTGDEERFSASSNLTLFRRFKLQLRGERSRHGLFENRLSRILRDQLSMNMSGRLKNGVSLRWQVSGSRRKNIAQSESLGQSEAPWKGRNNIALQHTFTLKNYKLETSLDLSHSFKLHSSSLQADRFRLDLKWGLIPPHTSSSFHIKMQIQEINDHHSCGVSADITTKSKKGFSGKISYTVPGHSHSFLPDITAGQTSVGLSFKEKKRNTSFSIDVRVQRNSISAQFNTGIQW